MIRNSVAGNVLLGRCDAVEGNVESREAGQLINKRKRRDAVASQTETNKGAKGSKSRTKIDAVNFVRRKNRKLNVGRESSDNVDVVVGHHEFTHAFESLHGRFISYFDLARGKVDLLEPLKNYFRRNGRALITFSSCVKVFIIHKVLDFEFSLIPLLLFSQEGMAVFEVELEVVAETVEETFVCPAGVGEVERVEARFDFCFGLVGEKLEILFGVAEDGADTFPEDFT